ncbi:hypothetical protein SLEP1_g55985 [Rubroshorea leprosula]|uniref:Uncharacterized protein n=1 Tax=Rubroshorea leprosula TaxID=152421 RepID=A0AAV5MH20_9ROSI|nr:hypothetical protein SLEP1_g55985 [Rubroshorea leprosula]
MEMFHCPLGFACLFTISLCRVLECQLPFSLFQVCVTNMEDAFEHFEVVLKHVKEHTR